MSSRSVNPDAAAMQVSALGELMRAWHAEYVRIVEAHCTTLDTYNGKVLK